MLQRRKAVGVQHTSELAEELKVSSTSISTGCSTKTVRHITIHTHTDVWLCICPTNAIFSRVGEGLHGCGSCDRNSQQSRKTWQLWTKNSVDCSKRRNCRWGSFLTLRTNYHTLSWFCGSQSETSRNPQLAPASEDTVVPNTNDPVLETGPDQVDPPSY
jgi:hypothetical protein